MIGRTLIWKSGLLVAPALLLQGCAGVPGDSSGYGYSGSYRGGPRMQRESMLNATWRGRSYNSLVEAFGSPKLVMNVPGYRQLKTTVVVYGAVDKVSKCIDAFTVVVLKETEDVIVSDYFCR